MLLDAEDTLPAVARVVEWPGLLWLVLATGVGAALMRLAHGQAEDPSQASRRSRAG